MEDVVTILPASPAWTDTDTMDGIEDLDAFLDAKGALSQFPTPPLLGGIVRLGILEDASEDESDDEVDELDIATAFAQSLSSTSTSPPAWETVLAIENLLLRARLPLEILALAFNVFTKLLQSPSLPGSTLVADEQKLLAATLHLALVTTTDYHPPISFWAKHVCQPPISAQELDGILLEMLDVLDWRLLDLAHPDAVAAAMQLFERRDEP